MTYGTNLADLRPGDPANFERPLRLADRLGGHLVQGHVDGVGKVVTGAPTLWVQAPPAIMRYLVEKGSITVDGCSLTVVDVLPDGFTVAIVPHTAEATTLGHRVPGEKVNLEVDLVAKYVERLLGELPPLSPPSLKLPLERVAELDPIKPSNDTAGLPTGCLPLRPPSVFLSPSSICAICTPSRSRRSNSWPPRASACAASVRRGGSTWRSTSP